MKKYIFGNWKMNLSLADAAQLAADIRELTIKAETVVAVFPSFLALPAVAEKLKGAPIALGGQDCFWEEKGAYTGEVSPTQLKEIGCSHVLIGHSERRQYLGETDTMVNAKVKAVQRAGLMPVVCVGESDEERRNGTWARVIENQVTKALAGVVVESKNEIVIAYEPIWAIGTGRACDPVAAREAHALIINTVAELYGQPRAKQYFHVLYGGSVDAKNIGAYLKEEGIDGALVGGASQKAALFEALIAAASAK